MTLQLGRGVMSSHAGDNALGVSISVSGTGGKKMKGCVERLQVMKLARTIP
jgi:hypothetical protein